MPDDQLDAATFPRAAGSDRRGSLARKLTSAVTIVMMLTGIAVGGAYYLIARQQLSAIVRDNLATIAVDRQMLLSSILADQQAMLELIASRTQLRNRVEQFLDGRIDDDRFQTDAARILGDAAQRLPAVSEITLCDPEAKLLLADRPLPEARAAMLAATLASARERAVISPFVHETEHDWSLGASPMFGSRGQLLAFVVARIDQTALVTALRNPSGLGETGEVLVGHLEGPEIYLSVSPRAQPHRQRMANEGLASLADARPDGTALGDVIDYRGQDVVVAYREVGYRDWGLLAKLDRAEAYRPIAETLRKIVLIQLAALALTLAGAHVVARRFVRPITALSSAADAIAAGDWRARAPIAASDEIGDLSATFNRMADRLAGASAELEKKVAERTAELASSESVLRSEREVLRSILDSMSDGVLLYDAQRNVATFNPAATRILGLADAGLNERPWTGLVGCLHEDRQTPLAPEETPLSRAARGEELNDAAFYLCNAGRPEGAVLSVSSRPLFDERRQVRGAVAVVHDISESVRSRQALEESRRRLQAIIDNSPAVIYLKDPAGRYLLINEQFRRIFKLADSAIIGRTDREIFPEPVAAAFVANDDRVRASNVPIVCEETAPHFDGPRTYVSVKFPLTGQPGAGNSVCGVSTDITERKQIEEALRESTERFERVIRGSTDGIWDWNTLTDEVYFSPRWKEMLGYADHELPNQVEVWRSLLHPLDRDRTLAALEDYLAGRSPQYEVEFRLRHRDGHYLWILSRGVAQRDDAGRPTRISGSHVDLTERKRAQEQLERTAADLARSNADLQQFAYVASHDLQEPLRMIASYVQLLAKRYHDQLDDDARDFIGYAVDGAHRMQALINDLLSYSRAGGQELDFARVDLNDVLCDVRQNLEVAIRESGATIQAEGLPAVRGDRSQLVQLFQNLVGNAIKFRGPHPPAVRIEAERQADAWRIAVCDNGIGLDPRYAEQIFMVFKRLHSRSKFPGTGVGLAICKRIVERHGGKIWVESSPGAGSTFYFTLPSGDA